MNDGTKISIVLTFDLSVTVTRSSQLKTHISFRQILQNMSINLPLDMAFDI